MLKVGLTGGLASGKSFAASEFERLGCPLLHADRVGRDLLADDAGAREETIAAFGSGIIIGDGSVDRSALARLVFADPAKLARLNAIIHPRVFRRIDAFFDAIGRRDPGAVAIVEAAIMIETGSYRRYDRVVLVACPRELQVRRFVERGSGTRADAEARLGRQMPLDEKRRFAHHVIDSGGSKDETLAQVRRLHGQLQAAASRRAGG